MDEVPLILVGEMWTDLVEWCRTSMLDPHLQLANPEDFNIPRCLSTADKAIAAIREEYAKWKKRQAAQAGAHHRR